MTKSGRFGKYGETKRLNRLRRAKIRIPSYPKGMSKKAKSMPSSEQAFFKRHLVELRPAEGSDIDFIGALSGKVFDIYGPYEEMIPRWFESDRTVTIIALMDSKPVGFAMMGNLCNGFDQQEVSELLAIAVEPEYQGRGVGEMLIRAIDKKAVELDVKWVFLHTAIKNERARRQFARNGYRSLEIKRVFYPAGQDAVVMCKEAQ